MESKSIKPSYLTWFIIRILWKLQSIYWHQRPSSASKCLTASHQLLFLTVDMWNHIISSVCFSDCSVWGMKLDQMMPHKQIQRPIVMAQTCFLHVLINKFCTAYVHSGSFWFSYYKYEEWLDCPLHIHCLNSWYKQMMPLTTIRSWRLVQ